MRERSLHLSRKARLPNVLKTGQMGIGVRLGMSLAAILGLMVLGGWAALSYIYRIRGRTHIVGGI
jgi:hypothetical protein